MNKNGEIELFKQFILNDIGASATRDFITCLNVDSNRNLNEYCDATEPDTFVSSAFNWEVAQYGFKFWHEVHEKWKYILKCYSSYNSIISDKSAKCKSIW